MINKIHPDQDQLMRFDPATSAPKPYPSHASQWRAHHGNIAWLYNPWTGTARDARDIGTDVFGQLILPPAPISAAGQLASIG